MKNINRYQLMKYSVNKAILVLGIMTFISLSANSQDVLVTQDGEALKVYDLEIGSNSIFYRTEVNKNAPISKMDLNNVLMIKWKDGRKQLFDEQGNGTVPTSNSKTQETVSATNEEKNATAISNWIDDEIKYTGEKTNKKAKMLFCVGQLDNNACIADNNMEISIKYAFNGPNADAKEYKYRKWEQPNVLCQYMIMVIKNNSTKTLYLDLANTFFIRGTKAEPYYIPSATSKTQGNSSGIGVSLGAVSVGGGKSQYETTTVFSQRVLAVPPVSNIELIAKELFPKDKLSDFGCPYLNLDGHFKCPAFSLPTQYMINVGEEKTIANGSDLPRFTFFVTYAENEDLEKSHTLNAPFYIGRIIGVPHKSLLGYPTMTFELNALTPNYSKATYFLIRQIQP